MSTEGKTQEIKRVTFYEALDIAIKDITSPKGDSAGNQSEQWIEVLDKGEWTNKRLEGGAGAQTQLVSCNNIIFILTTVII